MLFAFQESCYTALTTIFSLAHRAILRVEALNAGTGLGQKFAFAGGRRTHARDIGQHISAVLRNLRKVELTL